MKQLTFGSLFAGVGGFDMGFETYGECKFQVEWDKNCQNVLNKHWPDVPKWGDISTVSGAELPPVDVIIFGSPCQDLSVAGKRAGLEGSRSGLFHEAIRIIKEMRDVTNGTFPRWTVWENVAGALSSNNGGDFATVINEMGKAGAYLSEYALLDAQFFGIPQRRRRVFLISCWDSATAAKCPDPLLPVSESLPGYFEKSKPKRKSASRTLTESVGDEGSIDAPNGGSEWWDGGQIADALTTTSNERRMPDKQRLQAIVEGQPALFVKSRRAQSATDDETWIDGQVAPTLNAFDIGDTRATTAIIEVDVIGTLKARGHKGVNTEEAQEGQIIVEQTVYAFDSLSSNSMKSSNPDSGVNEVEEPIFFQAHMSGEARIKKNVMHSLSAVMGTGGNNMPLVAFDTQFGSNANVTEDISPTLKASQQSPSVAYSIQDGRDMEKHQTVAYDGYNQKLDESGIHRSLRVGRDSGDFVAQPVEEPTVFQPGTMVRLGGGVWEGTVPTLRAESKRGDNEPHIQLHDGEPQMAVRRLTPSECELLMGWPLDHTLYKADGSIQSDTHRYKQIGNGVATPVAKWVAKQIWQVEQL